MREIFEKLWEQTTAKGDNDLPQAAKETAFAWFRCGYRSAATVEQGEACGYHKKEGVLIDCPTRRTVGYIKCPDKPCRIVRGE